MRELYGAQQGEEGLYKAIGYELADMKREAYEKARAEYAPKIAALEGRINQLEQMLATAVDQQVEEITKKFERLERTVGRKETEVTGGARIADEQIQRAVEKVLAPKLMEMERRFTALVEQRVDQHFAQTAERKEADLQATARIVGEQIQEPLNQFVSDQVRGAVEKALAPKLTEIEQRLMLLVGQRFDQHLVQMAERKDADLEAIARSVGERIQAPLNQFVLSQVHDAVKKELAMQLLAIEQRLKLSPGKLPVAKTWRPETVVYQSEFVVHDGALWQATKDTAQSPGGGDWICAARAGRDAVTPAIRGTYSVDENYQQLDIVAMDGGAFIARRDYPGVCPGPDWQMIAHRGKPGRPGATGPRGPQGEKGEPGKDGAKTVSYQLDRAGYRMSPLLSDGTVGEMMEFRAFFEQFLVDRGEL